MTPALADGGARGRADPAYDAHLGPIGHRAMAVWEDWVAWKVLQRLVVRAQLRLARAKSPWAIIFGPAAAFVAWALRIG